MNLIRRIDEYHSKNKWKIVCLLLAIWILYSRITYLDKLNSEISQITTVKCWNMYFGSNATRPKDVEINVINRETNITKIDINISIDDFYEP